MRFVFKTPRDFNKGEMIIETHDEDDTIYVVLDGLVRIIMLTEDGDMISYRTIAQRDYFGWLAAIDGKKRLTAAVAVTDLRVLPIKSSDFYKIVETYPSAMRHVMRRMCETVRDYSYRIETLSSKSVKDRIMQELLRRADPLSLNITINSHEDLATWVNASRESVTRNLKELENSGMIIKDGKGYKLN